VKTARRCLAASLFAFLTPAKTHQTLSTVHYWKNPSRNSLILGETFFGDFIGNDAFPCFAVVCSTLLESCSPTRLVGRNGV
jgi:hypothetical protein